VKGAIHLFGEIQEQKTTKTSNMACISTTFKYIVLLFNLLFFFLGCAIIGVGIYMQVKMAAYFDLLGDITINSATIFIIVGVIITIISFFWMLWCHHGKRMYDVHLCLLDHPVASY
jgi:sterol desaturase/sphingolipid hydroxylase (fatty acid hydroxylase superfamily)